MAISPMLQGVLGLKALENAPGKKARHWIVAVVHNWFNPFRKSLVRWEKLHSSFMAWNHLAAAISVFGNIEFAVHIICG